MPFDDAPNYRFDPFDLIKMWPHGDYPFIEVGRMMLDRNSTDYHTEIEQAAFQPNNLVPGIGPSPDKMLLARLFAYADAHRARIGVNFQQLPVNAPHSPVNSYSKTARYATRMCRIRCTPRNPRVARRLTATATVRRLGGISAGTWCTPHIPCMRRMTTGARPVR